MVPEPFKLPESFSRLPGKTVYVSLGSLFSAYVEKLQRLVDTLNEIPNLKFVVSKGVFGEKLKLPDNGRFCGDNWLPQLAVLQSVDAAIVHGGYVKAVGFAFVMRLTLEIFSNFFTETIPTVKLSISEFLKLFCRPSLIK